MNSLHLIFNFYCTETKRWLESLVVTKDGKVFENGKDITEKSLQTKLKETKNQLKQAKELRKKHELATSQNISNLPSIFENGNLAFL